jgi:hypothetical protein
MPERSSTPSRSGRLGSCSPASRAFYEGATAACNGRAIHGWQMVFRVTQRTLYDLVADAIDRSYTHKNGPNSRCSERSHQLCAGGSAGLATGRPRGSEVGTNAEREHRRSAQRQDILQ